MTLSGLSNINIELSSICGYACVGCPHTYITRPKGHMSLPLYSAIIEEVGLKLERIYLWNYGESLLNPNAMEMLILLRRYSAAGFMSTTGSVFEKNIDWSPLAALEELVVSINGLDEPTYAIHQRGGNLARVLRGLPRIGEIMADAPTRYVLQFVANRRNLHQIERLSDFARKYRFKQVCVKTFNVMDGMASTYEGFVPDDPRYSRYAENIDAGSLRSDPCLNWMVVNQDGNILPCCYDYNSEIVLGNAKNGIESVWASEPVQRHRQLIMQHKYYHFCDRCIRKSRVFRKDV